MSLYIRTTRKIKKVREKFLILAKYFFRATRMVIFLLYGVPEKKLNMDGSYDYDKFMSILPEL